MGSTEATTVPTSLLMSWYGPGCSGQMATVEFCGCSDLQFYGGQDLTQGETATFYTETGCAGTPYQVFGGFEGTQWCGDVGWRSINIDC
ncbi:hypothetical protein BAE44_0018269 [Dichanthelium oligosanthes]|uniref:Uncharacterized protein n=1 Tax=Dichanthelium oligosanthes TaxID=888268 RepID=A0A1E5V6G5_9POAL|nr:hypothetical protein BAE44_0018269 [Dichanthelium oligosanthes]